MATIRLTQDLKSGQTMTVSDEAAQALVDAGMAERTDGQQNTAQSGQAQTGTSQSQSGSRTQR